MSELYSSVANSPWMWFACGAGILWVCFQAVLFLRRSIQSGREMGITREQLRMGIKSASMASIGPCLVLLSSMLSLLTIVGSPLAWLRVNVIGGVGYEIMGATFAANAMGVAPGSEGMTVDYLCVAAIVMTVGCLGWIVFAALFSDKMERVNRFMAGGRKTLIPIVSAGCALGCYSSLVSERVYPVSPGTLAAGVSALVMFALLTLAKKGKAAWVKDWALTIAMLCGMAASLAMP